MQWSLPDEAVAERRKAADVEYIFDVQLEAVGMGIDGEHVGQFGLGIAMEWLHALHASGSRR